MGCDIFFREDHQLEARVKDQKPSQKGCSRASFASSIFFSCIAGRVRDMVGQLLEIRLELKANWMQKFPWKRTQNNKKNKPQNTPQQAPNNNTTAREIRKTK